MGKVGDIAIIGIGAHYPGALDIKILWENIIARREQFRRFPDERLPIDIYTDLTQKDKDKSYVTQGAFIDGFTFDREEIRDFLDSYDPYALAIDIDEKGAIENNNRLFDNLRKKYKGVFVRPSFDSPDDVIRIEF